MAASTTKQRAKQAIRRAIGEPYVGKRLKMHALTRALMGLPIRPSSILDAGSEDATFVYWLADRFPHATVTAIDIDEAAIATCERARPDRYRDRVTFRVCSFDSLEPGSVDLVTAFDVLEHIEGDSAALVELYRALRPGGWLLVHVPRDVWTHPDGRQDRMPDDEAWTINPGHVRTGYDPDRLAALAAGAGFEIVSVQTWVRRWGARAYAVYRRTERPTPLRVLSLPVTDLAARLDRRRPANEGNTVFVAARRPA